MATDAKSLFDHVKKVGHLTAERQTALDLHLTKQMVEAVRRCPHQENGHRAVHGVQAVLGALHEADRTGQSPGGAPRFAPKRPARKAQAPDECRLVNSNTLFPLCELQAAWHAVDKPQLCTHLSMRERLLPASLKSP